MPTHHTPMIGRDTELAEVLSLTAAAADGNPTVVVVAGDAGVGKSRLVDELAERLAAEGTRVLIGRCVNLPDGGLPYLPFVDAFRGLDTDSWHRIEPHLTGGAAQPLGQLQLYEAVVELLFELAGDRPACLVVEDLHWADRPSKDLLRYLIGRIEHERLTLILTYRSDDLHRRHPLRPFLADLARQPLVRRITLGPLSPEAIAALITASATDAGGTVATATGEVDRAVVDDIVARAEGNAFFAEELLEAAQSARAGAQPGVLPDALRDVLLARLEQLTGRAADVVGVAAVAGRRVSHDVLAAVTSLPDADLDEALRDAVTRHVLVPDRDTGGYEFRHALLQEAAYTELLPGERVRLHRAYAGALSQQLADNPSAAAELAYHAELSHDLGLALAASVRAAEHAQEVHAPSEAQRHLEHVLAWWGAVADAADRAGCTEVDIYLRAAQAAAAAGDSGRSVALLLEADRRVAATVETPTDSAGGPPDVANLERAVVIRSRLAAACYYAGDERDEKAAAEALALAEALPAGAARAQARSTGAVIRFVHDKPGARQLAELALADAEHADAANLQAEALVTLARIAEQAGEADTAAEHFTRALALAEAGGAVTAELRTLFNLAMSRYDAGDLPKTLYWTQRSIDRAAATGMAYSEYAREARGINVIARYVSGDWEAGLRPLWDADRIPATVRPVLEAFSLHVAVGRGLPDVNERLARLRATRHPDPNATAQLVVLTAGCEIDHLTWQQNPQAALRVYRANVDYPVTLWGEHYLARIWLAALALAALADTARAARLRDDVTAAAAATTDGEPLIEDARAMARFGVPRGGRLGAEGIAWLARAEAEYSRLRADNDAGVWRKALAAFDYGYRYEVARCRWRLAEVLLDRAAAGDGVRDAPASTAAGDGALEVPGSVAAGDEAAGLLRLAYADAQSLGAAPLAQAVVALARRAKITGVGPPVTVSALTPREQEVLDLLARGSTNRQIGTELFISEKTASVHVSNILSKLGAGTRGEAVAIARRRGLLH